MGRIKDLTTDLSITGLERIVSTDVDFSTKNITIDSIKEYINTGVSIPYTLPNSIGTEGQILQYPAIGTTLEWVDQGVVDLSGLQDQIVLTTVGTSGAATLTNGNELNIPQYSTSVSSKPIVNVSTSSNASETQIDKCVVLTSISINYSIGIDLDSACAIGDEIMVIATAGTCTVSSQNNIILNGVTNNVGLALTTYNVLLIKKVSDQTYIIG